MFYRSYALVLLTAIILTTGWLAHAKAGSGESPVSGSEILTFEGLLVVREADGVFLVRSDDGQKKRFTCSKNTAIIRNGQPAAYGDLRSRDHIRVHYSAHFVVTAIQASGS